MDSSLHTKFTYLSLRYITILINRLFVISCHPNFAVGKLNRLTLLEFGIGNWGINV